MSKNLFAFATSAWTALGIAATMAGAAVSEKWELNLVFLLGVLVAGIAGVIIALKSDVPIVSLFGYMLVAIPFGLMLGPVVALYTMASVVRVFFVTTGMVVALGIVGAVIPDSLEGLGSWLFGGLVALLIGLLIVPIAGMFGVPIKEAMTILDWVGVVLFSGYVVYDWNRAMRVPFTLDNSIDCALAVYLDWINLFIRLLELTGTKKSDD
ncbi:US12 family protein [Candidatus Gottesmanbacteria bacterium]|nr:US12 family protein [Candidatus Gottesmanbacteria bacterium]